MIKNQVKTLENLVEEYKSRKVNYSTYEFDELSYRTLILDIHTMLKENQKYKEVINKMKTNLDSSINAINKKLSNNKFRIENGKAIYPINDYCVIRLKGIRTKCKELLKILNEVEHE